MAKTWQAIAQQAQQKLWSSIPEAWRLPEDQTDRPPDAREVIRSCGLLTGEQIQLTERNATELLADISAGRLTCVEVTEAFLIRAALAHQLVNCLMDFYPEVALERAKELDAEFSRTGKPLGPLHGLPITIKDILDVKGRVATMASIAWAANPPSVADASTVKVMRDAGAIIFGRTTLPQTGMALETVSNLWGRTLNPFNPAFGSGGSSGGEAALAALRGTPASPLSTDIGGSIRAPAAFNGLYAIRPTSDRVPKTGQKTPAPGNVSIKTSAGPACHSMDDLKLFTKLILTHPTIPYEPSCCMPYWHEPPAVTRKLRVGVMYTDGIVEPHPPIRRAIQETTAKLQSSGYEVVDFQPPFDLWEAAVTTWALYFQTGAKEMLALLEKAGEPKIKQFQFNFDVFKVMELTVPELFKRNTEQAAYKLAFQQAWDAAAIDMLICPCAPLAGSPHDFPVWWGYTTIWNLLDYPSVVLPIKDFAISAAKDPKDTTYQPRDNPYDKPNWEIYDPEKWSTQPVTLQLVGRPYRDELLIAHAEAVDGVVNGKSVDTATRL